MIKRLKIFTMAALVVLAACDEGEDGVGVGETGTVTGLVSVDGTAQSGVSVALSSVGSVTTDAAGRYTFSDVAAGAYTVTITPPTGAACPSTSLSAVISTAGQTVTVDFACSAIMTSSVVATGLMAGVTATLSGAGTGTRTVDATGVASFTGLAAGTYSVAISTVPVTHTCTPASQSTTVAAGETKSVAFTCMAATGASITGRLFLDSNANDTFESGTDGTLAAADVTIRLEGPNVGDTTSMPTDANGEFAFPELTAGSYNVTIDENDPAIPDNFSFSGANLTVAVLNLPVAGTSMVNFPFTITSQTITVQARLGRDANAATGISTSIPATTSTSPPLAGVILDLYPTGADAVAVTNRLGSDTTDATGTVSFTFLREDDTSPGGGQDQIVFATFVAAPDNFHVPNGEARIEIPYDLFTATDAADDEFDFLNTRVTMKFDALTESSEALEGWAAALWLNDTTAAAPQSGVTDADGAIFFSDAVGAAALPDSFYMRLSAAQAAAGSHAFTQTPTPADGEAANLYLLFVHQGLVAAGDTADVGDEVVRFLDTDLFVRVYHERDDSLPGGPPLMTAGDNIDNVDNVLVTLSWGDSARTDLTPSTVTGNITFGNVPTGMGPYTISARSVSATQVVLQEDTIVVADLLGGTTGVTRVCPLGTDDTDAGCATFAFKYNNTFITGKVKAADSTAAEGIIVTMTPTADNIEPGITSLVDTTDAGGLFAFADLREGPYAVSVTGTAEWQPRDPESGTITVDMENQGDNDILNSIVRRMDTEIHGVVVNDRDEDLNTIDIGEALPGVTVQLYRDNDGAEVTIDADSLVGDPKLTDANGAYSFTGLPEGRYLVRAIQPTDAVVLRAYEASGAVRDTAIVNTTATTTGSGANFTRVVGTTTPVSLPRWNYDNSSVMFSDRTHFTFLVNGNIARGEIEPNGGGVPLANKRVTLRRCLVSTTTPSTSPPTLGVCDTFFPGDSQLTPTDLTGFFTYSNLVEGVYQIVPIDPATPSGRLFRLVRNGEAADNERGDFTLP